MANECNCGCNSTMTVVTKEEGACQCGCAPTQSKEEEIAELLTLQARIESRLAEIKPETVSSN